MVDEPSCIFDRLAAKISEAKANPKSKAVAICINKAGVMALCDDKRIYTQSIGPHNILQKTIFGLPLRLLDDRPKDKFPDHWRFYLEYESIKHGA